jgi:hypothetical protein
VTHPYRTPPPPEPARGAQGNLGPATVMFGFVCALVGQALGGPGCCLVATAAGVFLILSPELGRPRR